MHACMYIPKYAYTYYTRISSYTWEEHIMYVRMLFVSMCVYVRMYVLMYICM